MLYIYPEFYLGFTIISDKQVYTPGAKVNLEIDGPDVENTFYGVSVTDEASFLQIEKKRLPPNLITKIFLENEIFFEGMEFKHAGSVSYTHLTLPTICSV